MNIGPTSSCVSRSSRGAGQEARHGAGVRQRPRHERGQRREPRSAALARPKPIRPAVKIRSSARIVPYIEAYRAAGRGLSRDLRSPHAPPARTCGSTTSSASASSTARSASKPISQDRAASSTTASTPPARRDEPAAGRARRHHRARAHAGPCGPPAGGRTQIVMFARRLRDTMEVFLKCFVSLRDGYQEFMSSASSAAIATRSPTTRSPPPRTRELGAVLARPDRGPKARAREGRLRRRDEPSRSRCSTA